MSRLGSIFSTFLNEFSEPEPEQRRESFEYDYTHLPPLAMGKTVPASQQPSSEWVELVAVRVASFVINTIASAESGFGGIRGYIRALEHAFDELPGEAKKDVGTSFVKALSRVGFPRDADGLRELFEAFLKDLASDVLFEAVKILLDLGQPEGEAKGLKDFADLFCTIELPAIAREFDSDEVFAHMRVAGPNPLVLERVEACPGKFPVSEQDFQAAMGVDDSLASAGEQGRLYLVDYAALGAAVAGSFPNYRKFLSPAMALFAVPRAGADTRRLVPVAIQCGQDSGSHAVITPPRPGSGADALQKWRMAKAVFNGADSAYHEAVSHLGRTHLVIEPFVVATHRTLLADPARPHAIGRLLAPHFEGTMFINNAAQSTLINSGGIVDALLAPTIDSSRAIAAKGTQGVLLDFAAANLPEDLKRRGVSDSGALPFYPFRDDALQIWHAIEEWVGAYVALHYSDDREVEQDAGLRAWAKDLGAFDGARVQGFADDGEFRTLTGLKETLTMLLFTASAQHAAVNFPQNDVMSFAPAMPWAIYAPAPGSESAEVGDGEYMAVLPRLDPAQTQLNIGYLLGGVHHTRLGHYPTGHFSDPRIKAPLAAFTTKLEGIEASIQQRNASLPAALRYPYLLPSKVPQSINI